METFSYCRVEEMRTVNYVVGVAGLRGEVSRHRTKFKQKQAGRCCQPAWVSREVGVDLKGQPELTLHCDLSRFVPCQMANFLQRGRRLRLPHRIN